MKTRESKHRAWLPLVRVNFTQQAAILAARVMTGVHKSSHKAAKAYLGLENASPSEVNKLRNRIETQLDHLRRQNAVADDIAAEPDVIPSPGSNRCGASDDAVSDAAEDTPNDAVDTAQACHYAFTLYHLEGYSPRGAKAETEARFGWSPSHMTIFRSSDDLDGANIRKPGPNLRYPIAGYEIVKNWILQMRARKVLVEREHVKAGVQQ